MKGSKVSDLVLHFSHLTIVCSIPVKRLSMKVLLFLRKVFQRFSVSWFF